MIAVSIPEAPPGGFLEDRLERQWAGAASSNGGAAHLPTYSSPAAAAAAAAIAHAHPYGGPGGGFGGGGLGGGVDSPSKYRCVTAGLG